MSVNLLVNSATVAQLVEQRIRNAWVLSYFEEKFYSYTHSKIPCIIIEPIKTDKESPNDLIGSPIQSHEQRITQINVNSRMSKDFFEKMCLIIVVKFDMFVS